MSELSTDEIIRTYFEQNDILVKHQIESYNDYIDNIIPNILSQFSPIEVNINSDKINFIKIDVEGLEFSVLKGMKNILKNNKKIKMLFEFMPKNTMEAGFTPIELLNYLTSYDFKLFCIDESTKKLLHVSNNEEILKLCSSTNNTIGRNLFCEK